MICNSSKQRERERRADVGTYKKQVVVVLNGGGLVTGHGGSAQEATV